MAICAHSLSSSAAIQAAHSTSAILTIKIDPNGITTNLQDEFRILSHQALDTLVRENRVLLSFNAASQAEYFFEQLIDELPPANRTSVRAQMTLALPGAQLRAFDSQACATARESRDDWFCKDADCPIAA